MRRNSCSARDASEYSILGTLFLNTSVEMMRLLRIAL
jgi:hypothetical protein